MLVVSVMSAMFAMSVWLGHRGYIGSVCYVCSACMCRSYLAMRVVAIMHALSALCLGVCSIGYVYNV